MTKQLTLAALLTLASSLGLAQSDAPRIREDQGRLACGTAQLAAKSHCLEFAENETQCTSQILTLTNPSKGIAKQLPHDGKRITQPFVRSVKVLDATVTGWACLTSDAGVSYIYLSYTCVEHDRAPECAGTRREWGRLFDTGGRALNGNLSRRSQHMPEVLHRYGLQRYVSEGIQLQDPVE